ncbi:MAG: endonuclease III domain-containing protein [Candidatus Competibacterales bacterium]
MSRKAKAAAIGVLLDDYYPAPAVPLGHRDPYTLLIAVVLSAQCTDARVNQVTPGLFARARTPFEMVQCSVADIDAIVRPCGLAPRKAKAIWQLSAQLIERHGGRVPADFEALEALPGVGHKTASVVMAQAFGIPAFPVDTHIHRLAYRWTLSTGKDVVQTERDLKAVFPRAEWNRRHLQIIYFGREHCPARGHDPYGCPLCRHYGRRSLFAEFVRAVAAKAAKAGPRRASKTKRERRTQSSRETPVK